MEQKVVGVSPLSLRSVIDSYLLDCEARRLSIHTVSDYRNTFRKLSNHFGCDKTLGSITRNDMRRFFASQTVGGKTLRNYYHCIKSLWNFAILEKVVSENPIDAIKRPKAEIRAIEPIPLEHLKQLVNTIDSTNPQHRARNKALVLMLIDTGVRVSELCGIRRSQANLISQSVKVFGKLSRERIVYFSASTAIALRNHLGNDQSDGPLFLTRQGIPMTRRNVTAVLSYVCKSAGIPFYSPHRFRHTFALTFLRENSNIFVLQRLLGHTTLEMSKRYLAISDVDVYMASQKNTPVAFLGL